MGSVIGAQEGLSNDVRAAALLPPRNGYNEKQTRSALTVPVIFEPVGARQLTDRLSGLVRLLRLG